jgi:hypothetical protein
MNPMEAASPPLIPLDTRRARLRGRPSGLKGCYRDRCATGPWPALDPGASAAPDHAAGNGQAHGAARPARDADTTDQDQIPTTKSLRFEGIADIQ